jgi:hypothetical protein
LSPVAQLAKKPMLDWVELALSQAMALEKKN